MQCYYSPQLSLALYNSHTLLQWAIKTNSGAFTASELKQKPDVNLYIVKIEYLIKHKLFKNFFFIDQQCLYRG